MIMANCPHCGKDTSTEPAAPTGTLDRGGQLYRQRRQGVRVEAGDHRPDNVGNDAA